MNQLLNLNRDTMISAGVCFSNRKFALLTKKARWRQIRIGTGNLIENFIIDVYKKLSIELLVQCGANEPTSAINFCQIRSGNQAICFEANPYIANKYMTINKNPRIKYLNMGLGMGVGKLNFYIPDNHPKDWTLQGTFSPTKQLTYSESFEVEVTSLDSQLPSLLDIKGFDADDFPKTALLIDVEGFSWEVLQGAKETLNLDTTKVIFIEVQDSNYYWEQEKNALQISNFLESYGFTPIVRDYPTAPLYNIIFVKNSEIEKLAEIIDVFWFKFTQIKPGFIELKDPRIILSKIKKVILLLIPKTLHQYVHNFFVLLGSKSSKI
jgi:FkbM family methyltransferase